MALTNWCGAIFRHFNPKVQPEQDRRDACPTFNCLVPAKNLSQNIGFCGRTLYGGAGKSQAKACGYTVLRWVLKSQVNGFEIICFRERCRMVGGVAGGLQFREGATGLGGGFSDCFQKFRR